MMYLRNALRADNAILEDTGTMQKCDVPENILPKSWQKGASQRDVAETCHGVFHWKENKFLDEILNFSFEEEHCKEQLLRCGSDVAFLSCDAVNLPFRDNLVDAIVTDLPFGKKIGSVDDNRVLYPRLLMEWERVVKPGGRLVVMTHDKRSWERALALHGGSWRPVSHHMVNVGGLQTLCQCLVNTKQ
ncbi:hypothetical protein Aduo_010868 [Ancylostoma duodenale]